AALLFEARLLGRMTTESVLPGGLDGLVDGAGPIAAFDPGLELVERLRFRRAQFPERALPVRVGCQQAFCGRLQAGARGVLRFPRDAGSVVRSLPVFVGASQGLSGQRNGMFPLTQGADRLGAALEDALESGAGAGFIDRSVRRQLAAVILRQCGPLRGICGPAPAGLELLCDVAVA